MLCVPASADLLAPNLNKSIDTIPIFDAGATAAISLTHGALTTCETFKAVLVQRAAALAAVLDEREVTACTPDANGHVDFTFSTPALVRETRLAWEFQACGKTSQCADIGDAEFLVLPPDYAQPLRTWDREHVIFLVDPSGKIAALLDRLGVAYFENSREVPDDTQVVNIVHLAVAGESIDPSRLPAGDVKRRIEFHSNPFARPIVWFDKTSESVVVEVRFPLIHETRHDAANKKLLVELFEALFI